MIKWWIPETLGFIYIIYTLVAELILHIWHISTLHSGNSDKRTIALTFDDGPDPNYTPIILDILRQQQISATFFVVGKHAAHYPQLVQRMVSEGHEIGSHSYFHRHAFLRTPFGIYRDIARAKRELEAMIARPLVYYRAPWGAMNWAMFWTLRKLRLQHVLWSVRAIDWPKGEYANDVVYRVVRAAHPGAIILCHDAGGAVGSTKNTIVALPLIIQQLQALGFSFTTVKELDIARRTQRLKRGSPFSAYPLFRRILIQSWQIVEISFTKLYHVLTINAIFRISLATWHHGARQDAKTGKVMIENGARALDLHFQNETLIAISFANDNRALVKCIHMVKTGLADLALTLEHHPDFADVQVVMALTLMNRGIELLGFHVEEVLKPKEKKRLQSYMRFLMGIYHPEGFKRLRQGTQHLNLKLVWMTRAELLTRYGQAVSTISK